MGQNLTYHHSWDTVFGYLKDSGNYKKHASFYALVEPMIKHRLLLLGFKEDLNAHAQSIFADLYVKELKRYRSGKLYPDLCKAQATTYYFPVIKNLCIDYLNLLRCKVALIDDVAIPEAETNPGVFESLWGDHKKTVLHEMSHCIQDWIELSGFEVSKKEYLRLRFHHGARCLESLEGLEHTEFETHRKLICRQGKKIAIKIAKRMLPAIIDCYKLPLSKEIDPRIIEKHLLGSKVKINV